MVYAVVDASCPEVARSISLRESKTAKLDWRVLLWSEREVFQRFTSLDSSSDRFRVRPDPSKSAPLPFHLYICI